MPAPPELRHEGKGEGREPGTPFHLFEPLRRRRTGAYYRLACGPAVMPCYQPVRAVAARFEAVAPSVSFRLRNFTPSQPHRGAGGLPEPPTQATQTDSALLSALKALPGPGRRRRGISRTAEAVSTNHARGSGVFSELRGVEGSFPGCFPSPALAF